MPVVAMAVGQIPEQVEDSVTGFLVLPGDPEAMAQLVVKLLEDEALRRRLSENVAMDACRRFDMNQLVEEYLRLYE
jgi:glycosyltransferase involved in cell wall biosynthesis